MSGGCWWRQGHIIPNPRLREGGGGGDRGDRGGGARATLPTRVCTREVVVVVVVMGEVVVVMGEVVPGPRHPRLAFARGKWWCRWW